jgi:predicted aldo/keto reductase-like oxidoreductase
MLDRKLGKTGGDVSVLGFGCLRFPIVGGRMAVRDAGSDLSKAHLTPRGRHSMLNFIRWLD